MENLRQYFDHILRFDHGRSSPNELCYNLFLVGAVLSKKPNNVLKLGMGSGYFTESLIYALRYNRKGKLTCVDSGSEGSSREPADMERYRSAGVRVFAPVPAQEFVNNCPANTYDFLIADADSFINALGIDALLRITTDKGFLCYRNANPGDETLHVTPIEKRLQELRLFHYHFSEQSRSDEPGHTGWLFAIKDKAKIANNESAGIQIKQRDIQPQRSDDGILKQGVQDQPAAETLYLGLVSGHNYGWGVCSRYLIQELSRIAKCQVLTEADETATHENLNGKLFQALTSGDFFAMFENARGQENYGYTFFENELSEHSVENAKKYDLVLAGSSWCRDRMLEKGITNGGVLIQGVDPAIFHPIDAEKSPDNFVIFSGGKFELRKGQDLVLQAVKILQQKYADIILANCWYNKWPQSAELMRYSKYIEFEIPETDSWQDLMHHIYKINGLDPTRTVTFDLVPNDFQREIYKNTDIGIFPNRCEGGTNLVLMEYMACAKPAIVSNTSGHKDIVNDENAILLNDMRDINLYGPHNELVARWQEPSLDELIAQIEYAYHHREEIKRMGRQAGDDLKNYTWERSAQSLLDTICA